MWGIGFGEILVILLVVFLVAPKEIPRVIKKVGEFMSSLDKLRRDLFDVERDVHGRGKNLEDPVRRSKMPLKKIRRRASGRFSGG
jgi:Sec-independent protein translocase protein TatA